jgi:alkanesulfonate monooxygenase SsuD/methylene tetrahydromethanopterin reductase-like flavin-dependent oxidoreductase (luciferase family)
LLAALAIDSDLVLGAIVPLASGRSPAVVAKLATTLALLAPGRCVIIFEADGDEGALVEAVVVAKALFGDGPIDAGVDRYVVRGAFNEPRPRRADLPAVGAIVDVVTDSLVDVADVILARSARQPSFARAGQVIQLLDERVIQLLDERAPLSQPGESVVVEIGGGDLDHIAAVVAKISVAAR